MSLDPFETALPSFPAASSLSARFLRTQDSKWSLYVCAWNLDNAAVAAAAVGKTM